MPISSDGRSDRSPTARAATWSTDSLVPQERCNREQVLLRGPDEGPNASQNHIFLVEADNVTIADISFGYCKAHGVQIRGEAPFHVSGTHISNCRLLNCNEQFIKGSGGSSGNSGARNGIIEYCHFEFTSGWAYQFYTGGIDIHRGVNWKVRDNLFLNLRNPNHLSNIAEHAIHFWRREAALTIHE